MHFDDVTHLLLDLGNPLGVVVHIVTNTYEYQAILIILRDTRAQHVLTLFTREWIFHVEASAMRPKITKTLGALARAFSRI